MTITTIDTTTTADGTIKELPAKGRWTVPAPTFVVSDDDGNTALVGAWSTPEATRKGRRMLTEHLERAPFGNLHVYPM